MPEKGEVEDVEEAEEEETTKDEDDLYCCLVMLDVDLARFLDNCDTFISTFHPPSVSFKITVRLSPPLSVDL